jgi:hypothetical protein
LADAWSFEELKRMEKQVLEEYKNLIGLLRFDIFFKIKNDQINGSKKCSCIISSA